MDCVGMPASVAKATCAEALSVDKSSSGMVELCPYAAHGDCPYADQCAYVHGDVCDLCHCAILSPFDLDQRQRHTEVNTVKLLFCMHQIFAIRVELKK